MKYTIEEIKKFLDPNVRYHMSAHVIQSEAVEMCRQLMVERKILVNALEDLHILPTFGYPPKDFEKFTRRVNSEIDKALKEVGEI